MGEEARQAGTAFVTVTLGDSTPARTGGVGRWGEQGRQACWAGVTLCAPKAGKLRVREVGSWRNSGRRLGNDFVKGIQQARTLTSASSN